MLSFCGRYGSGGGRRFDVTGALASVGLAVKKDNDSKDKDATAAGGGDGDEAAAGGGVGSKARPGTSLMFDVFAPSGHEQGREPIGEEGQGLLSVVVVVDPLSLAGQRAASVIALLQQHLRLPLTVVLLPSPHIRDFPLQNFYRYVASPYTPASPLALAPVQTATFHALPRANIFTLRVDAPEPWNIQASAAYQDIDNLRCQQQGGAGGSSDSGAVIIRCGDPHTEAAAELTRVTYALKTLLVAGQCFQTAGTGVSILCPSFSSVCHLVTYTH